MPQDLLNNEYPEHLLHRHHRADGHPSPLAQIPASGFPALGSSSILASVIYYNFYSFLAILLSEVCFSYPALHVRLKFPLRFAYTRYPLPHVAGSPDLRVLLDNPTSHNSSAILFFDWVCLPTRLEIIRPPKFLTLLFIHTMSSDPDRPSRILPFTIPLC